MKFKMLSVTGTDGLGNLEYANFQKIVRLIMIWSIFLLLLQPPKMGHQSLFLVTLTLIYLLLWRHDMSGRTNKRVIHLDKWIISGDFCWLNFWWWCTKVLNIFGDIKIFGDIWRYFLWWNLEFYHDNVMTYHHQPFKRDHFILFWHNPHARPRVGWKAPCSGLTVIQGEALQWKRCGAW